MFATLCRDRFYFTALLAIGIHAVLVLGIRFEQEPQRAMTELLSRSNFSKAEMRLLWTASQSHHTTIPRSPTHLLSENPTSKHSILLTQGLNPSNLPRRRHLEKQRPRRRGPEYEAIGRANSTVRSTGRQTRGDARRKTFLQQRHQVPQRPAYLAMWRRKCERLGGNNYPAGGLQGELTSAFPFITRDNYLMSGCCDPRDTRHSMRPP